MWGIGGLKVLNKAKKTVDLEDGVKLIYEITYDEVSKKYIYIEYIKEQDVTNIENKFNITKLRDVLQCLEDICGHYGELDYIIYNDGNRREKVVIGLSNLD